MFKQRLKQTNHGCSINVHAERPVHKKPEIVETYFDADVVDRIFNPVKTAIKHKRYKGKTPDTTAIFLSY